MNDNIYTIKEAERRIDIFGEYQAVREAYLYLKELEEFLGAERIREIDPGLYERYSRLLIKLKFLSLNFFDDWEEIVNLIKNNFEIIYEIKNYDLWKKIKINLLSLGNLAERDKIKEELKKTLLSCDKIILDKKKYERYINFPFSVADWLKDYNSILGIKEVDNLKRVQYLTNGEYIKKLDEADKNKLKILFDFYENLKASSNTSRGFESDIPMVIEGKHVIFTGGRAEEIKPDLINLIKSVKIPRENNNKLAELRAMVGQYPAGSLERKAIEEEMRKISKL